jgi:hypothetical protein
MNRKFLVLPVAAALALSLSACGEDADRTSRAPDSSDPARTAQGPSSSRSPMSAPERPGAPEAPGAATPSSPGSISGSGSATSPSEASSGSSTSTPPATSESRDDKKDTVRFGTGGPSSPSGGG